jgi:hypothetical protein
MNKRATASICAWFVTGFCVCLLAGEAVPQEKAGTVEGAFKGGPEARGVAAFACLRQSWYNALLIRLSPACEYAHRAH